MAPCLPGLLLPWDGSRPMLVCSTAGLRRWCADREMRLPLHCIEESTDLALLGTRVVGKFYGTALPLNRTVLLQRGPDQASQHRPMRTRFSNYSLLRILPRRGVGCYSRNACHSSTG